MSILPRVPLEGHGQVLAEVPVRAVQPQHLASDLGIPLDAERRVRALLPRGC